ncbi:DUF1848 domain-containing protein [Sporolituus thermophilus]|uniref:DUF1848 domain-containing protein n=1 Tax=Sporolituus thermophilus DSM 23256 TaxID=1123285 RepID=A0A1G7N8Z5_9FIRM|nr:DUF1848 domain-containing protein [Sporolituus thermophilus]SDF70442.1 protein of unknown function [Sporolituus thermophilus DSM 23256]
MIISASRRTDIPAFYAEWFMNRIRANFCTVVNPFNRTQVSHVSLHPRDVDVIVFWTRNARPLLPYLAELSARGYRYYFHYTLTGYPSLLEPYAPSVEQSMANFRELAGRIGADKLIWRYDPILVSDITDYEYHRRNFAGLAARLEGYTRRVVVSLADEYRKATNNFRKLTRQGITVRTDYGGDAFAGLMICFSAIAREHGMEIFSCAEVYDLTPFGIFPGKCIDDKYLRAVFGIQVAAGKDKSQRPACGCVPSKDIGFYETCLHGCLYCYAGTYPAARKNRLAHDPVSPSLIGWYNA